MRKFCWVYVEKSTGDLWVCRHPHRREWFKRWELERELDDFEVVEFRELMDRFEFVGRL